MKITNKHNLPEAVVGFLSKDHYTPGDSDFSVTELLGPPQIRYLKKKHREEIEEDVVDKIWSLLGHGVHNLLEQHAVQGTAEERRYVQVGDYRIGGQVDHYEGDTITDYKVTSVNTIIYGNRIEEWTEQLNIYAFIWRSSGLPVKALRVCAILRDWSKTKARRDSSYPQTPVLILPLATWTDNTVYEFIVQRLDAHLSKDVPECTKEEVWAKPTKYAVMKRDAERATRVFDTHDEAVQYMTDPEVMKKGEFHIEERPGERPRCMDYCPVAKFCPQWKKFNGQ